MDAESDKRKGALTPYTTGYSFPPATKSEIKSWLRTNLALTVATALGDQAMIFLIAATHLWLGAYIGALVIPTYLMAAVLIARYQRGLEVFVHEGSHYSWCRSRREVNDWLTNLLAAVPVFARVSSFRQDHLEHHSRIGTDDDPCFRRYVGHLDMDGIDRSSVRAYVGTLACRLPRYMLGWWTGPFGVSRTSITWGVTWHVAVVVVPLSHVLGFEQALMLWGLYFLIPFVLFLPVLRLMGEANKHDYTNNDGTVRGSTFNNVGLVHFFLHPHGDNFHALHHLHPAIPHHKLAQADAWLMAHDARYAAGLRRQGVIDDSTSSITASDTGAAHVHNLD